MEAKTGSAATSEATILTFLIAEGELTRDLTEEECRQYLHEACPPE